MTDYISRDAVINIMKRNWALLTDANDAMQESIDAIRELPAADVVERKKGKWMRISYKSGYGYKCSVCGSIYNKRKRRLNFCPNCGADMREEQT